MFHLGGWVQSVSEPSAISSGTDTLSNCGVAADTRPASTHGKCGGSFMRSTGQPGSRWPPPGSGVRNVGVDRGRSAPSNADDNRFQVTNARLMPCPKLWPAGDPPISADRGSKMRSWKAEVHFLGRATASRGPRGPSRLADPNFGHKLKEAPNLLPPGLERRFHAGFNPKTSRNIEPNPGSLPP